MEAVVGHTPHVHSYAASLAARVRLSHHHAVRSARGAIWRLVTTDPEFHAKGLFLQNLK
jgi:phosphohistidine phosphatase SixA